MLSNQLSVARNNGINEQQILETSTSGSIKAGCSPTTITTGGCDKVASSTVRSTTDSIAPNIRAPYSLQFNVGIDQQLGRIATVSSNYQHIRGVHQFVDTISNYVNPQSNNNLNYAYVSEGEFDQNQLITNVNIRGIKNITMFGYYSLNFDTHSDTSGINAFNTVPGNIKADYGRASFDIRSQLFVGGNIALPHLISLAPLIQAKSGTPLHHHIRHRSLRYRPVQHPRYPRNPGYGSPEPDSDRKNFARLWYLRYPGYRRRSDPDTRSQL